MDGQGKENYNNPKPRTLGKSAAATVGIHSAVPTHNLYVSLGTLGGDRSPSAIPNP